MQIWCKFQRIFTRIPKGTLCLTTALARHGLTDNIPARIDAAIPRRHRIPVLQSPVDIRVFAKEHICVRTRGTDAHGTRDRGTAAGSNIYLKENQALIQELQVDPFAEKVIPES